MPKIENGNRLKGIGFVLLASLGYGVMPALSQLAFKSGVDINTMLANRYFIALLITWSYIFIRKIDFRVSRKQFVFMMAVGVLYIGIAMCINNSYLYLPGAIASILIFSYVSLVVIFEIIIGREKPNLTKIICVIISIVGLSLVVWSPSGNSKLSIIGISFALGAGIFYGIYATTLGGKMAKGIDATILVAYVLIVPAIFYPIRCIMVGETLFASNLEQFSYILAVTVICTFLATLWFCFAVRLIGSSTSAIINTIEPVIAYFAGMFFLGDVLSPNSIFGGLLIIVAIVLLNVVEGTKEKVTLER